MATGTHNPQQAASKKRRKAKTVTVKEFVSGKLDVTRNQVRQVDVISNLISLFAIVLIFFLSVAIVDAWIYPLGSIGRWAGFLTLIVGSIAFLYYTVGRTMLRKINPDYAAMMIEDSQPEFKNSLLNYVSLSRQPQGTKAAVLDAVSRQAATDISTVPVETMVDRSPMIRVSMILAGIIALGAVYTLASPKNPFQSIARVIFPSAKLAAPSVVTIDEVSPGDAERFFGDEVEVLARVTGSHSASDVKLIYSTKDGQVVDRVIPMTVQSGTTDRYAAILSGDGAGIQQSVIYRIEARDGKTPDYEINVRTNPSIAIENVSLTPLPYTNLQPWTQPMGNLEVLEGTKITIEAKANLPIETAEIELLNETEQGTFVSAQRLRMNVDSEITTKAVGSFNASLNRKRTRPIATHYRLNFKSVEGHKNQQANNFPIKITPDLAPEIKILNPLDRTTSVPVNGSAMIRVQANDADFEISKLTLQVERDGLQIHDKPMQLAPLQGMRRVNGEFLLNISGFPIVKVGDQLTFRATAFDNRVSPNGKPAPNTTDSDSYVIEVTEPQEQTQQRRDRQQPNENPADQNQQPPGEQTDQSEQERPFENDQQEFQEQNKDPENRQQDRDDRNPENRDRDSESQENQNSDNSDGSQTWKVRRKSEEPNAANRINRATTSGTNLNNKMLAKLAMKASPLTVQTALNNPLAPINPRTLISREWTTATVNRATLENLLMGIRRRANGHLKTTRSEWLVSRK